MRILLSKLSIFSVLFFALFIFSFGKAQAAWVCPGGTIMSCANYNSSTTNCSGGRYLYWTYGGYCTPCSSNGNGSCYYSTYTRPWSSGGIDYCYSGACTWQPDQNTNYGTGPNSHSFDFTCTPQNNETPYRWPGIDFKHGSCSEGNGGSCSSSCPGSSTNCSSGSNNPGNPSTAPYRCGLLRVPNSSHNDSEPGQYLTNCKAVGATGYTCTGSACTYGCATEAEPNKTCSSTSYSGSLTCGYTNYYDQGGDHTTQDETHPNGSWTADVGTQHGCKVPATNSSAFDDSPQKDNTDGTPTQTDKAAGEEIGGCGTGTFGSPNGCKQNICEDSPVNHTTESCRRARDGNYQCGGVAGCGENVCDGREYLDTGTWGTNPGFQQLTLDTMSNSTHALNNSPRKNTYEICKLNTVEDPEALEACSVTPTEQGANNTGIACRCGQQDMCGRTNLPTTDLTAQPAILRIANLSVENSVGGNMVNTYGKHRLRVTFSLAANQPGGRARALAYTRLIEVCPVNMQDSGWAIPVNNNDPINPATGRATWPITSNGVNLNHWCVIKRVDGNEDLINAGVTIDIPNIVKDNISEGPWTVKYRTINDVCNRTYHDAGPAYGRTEYCQGGANCLNVGATSDVTGKMGGIQDQGNIYGNLTPGSDFNYCSI